MNTNPASASRNVHHTKSFQSLEDFYEQFRYDPDYPDTTSSNVDVTDPEPF